ncbi:unnamed protein product [Lymnaea stagnalis]|uniref:C-type lectin domain-containing protein n=1 Tax=Lymnaea stagnalis TaxID=6523 RepID=A0AAV2HM42_LYMST
MELMTHLVCFAFLAVWSVPTVADVHLDVSTPEIKVGCTDTLTITCNVTGDASSTLKYLVSILISLRGSTNETTYADVASLVKIGPHEDVRGFYDNVTVWGNGMDLSKAHLAAQWRHPSERLAGDYRCVVTGLDEVGHHITLTANATVAVAVTDAVDADKIKEIEARLEEEWNAMKSELVAENERWAERFQELRGVLFTKETFYNNHHYLLTRNVYNNIEVAAALCRLYSGYLVQIDDSDEYNAIVSFLGGVFEFDSVFISGTDRGNEGHWVFQGTNTSMPFTRWGSSGASNGGDTENCIVLWKASTWEMYDQPCYDNIYKVGTICEKPMVN